MSFQGLGRNCWRAKADMPPGGRDGCIGVGERRSRRPRHRAWRAVPYHCRPGGQPRHSRDDRLLWAWLCSPRTALPIWLIQDEDYLTRPLQRHRPVDLSFPSVCGGFLCPTGLIIWTWCSSTPLAADVDAVTTDEVGRDPHQVGQALYPCSKSTRSTTSAPARIRIRSLISAHQYAQRKTALCARS